MKRILFSLLLITSVLLNAQTEVVLRINHFLGTNAVDAEQVNHNSLGQEFKVTRCVYYMSKFTVIHDGGMETDITTDTIALIDAFEGPYTDVELGDVVFTTIEGVRFHVGVQEPENNADPSLWPATHPLAHQTPSMHWGWTAGYRFATFEGLSGEGFEREISLHGIGNENYFTTTVMNSSITEGSAEIINISGDYRKVVSAMDISLGVISHGEAKSVLAMENFNLEVFGTHVLSIKEENTLNYWRIVENAGVSTMVFNEVPAQSYFKIVDLSGKLILMQEATSNTVVELPVIAPGLYVVSLVGSNSVIKSAKHVFN